MKPLIAILVLWCAGLPAHAQIVPNGGFEQWDSTFVPPAEYPFPMDWIWSLPNICSSGNFLAVPDTLSHSGAYSAKLESQVCTNGPNHVLEEGLLFSGGPYMPPRDFAFPCMSRPSHLNFHYMFHREGNDSGYVKVFLFNYDSITPGLSFFQRMDTVGYSTGYMDQEVSAFTPFSLPINYLTADTPAFIHIHFSTSKTLSENYGNTPPYLYAYPGTTLWVDDVHLSGGATGLTEHAGYEAPVVYPNPGRGHIRFMMPQGSALMQASVFEVVG